MVKNCLSVENLSLILLLLIFATSLVNIYLESFVNLRSSLQFTEPKVISNNLSENVDLDDLNNTDQSVPLLFNELIPVYTLGHGQTRKVTLAIGILLQKEQHYFSQTNIYSYITIRSALGNIFPNLEEEVSIVVLLPETDLEFIKVEARYLYGNFTREIRSGILQIYSRSRNFHSQVRSKKKIIDIAYLMFACRNKAKYYLMLDENVVFSKGYVTSLSSILKKFRFSDYVYLSLGLKSAGRLIQSSHIPVWFSYFINFYKVKRFEFLLNDLVRFRACNPAMSESDCQMAISNLRTYAFPKLLQRVGRNQSIFKSSSIRGNVKNTHRNPAAKIITSFTILNEITFESWYSDSGSLTKHLYIDAVRFGDYVNIALMKSQNVKKILIKSGKTDGSEKFCSGCAILAFNDTEQCAVFDQNGIAECVFRPAKLISRIQVKVMKNQPRRTHLNLIFIS